MHFSNVSHKLFKLFCKFNTYFLQDNEHALLVVH